MADIILAVQRGGFIIDLVSSPKEVSSAAAQQKSEIRLLSSGGIIG